MPMLALEERSWAEVKTGKQTCGDPEKVYRRKGETSQEEERVSLQLEANIEESDRV